MSSQSWYPDDPQACLALADAIVIVHFAVVAYVIFGELLILLGGLLRWSWVRNRWFRAIHLGIMTYIVVNAIRGELCFLTHWERDLRREAGQTSDEEISFVGGMLRDALFVDVPQASLDQIYLVFGTLVVVSILFVRPNLRGTRPAE